MTYDQTDAPEATVPEQTPPSPAGAIDLKDPDFHERPDQYDILKYLRDHHPVYWNPEVNGRGFWAVTRFEDVEAVTRRRDVFSSDYKRGGMRINDIDTFNPNPRPDIFNTDPPDHTVFRKAFQPLFTPEAVATFRDRIRARVRSRIAAMAPKGRADFVTELANPIVQGLLTDLLEVPESDGELLMTWSNALVGIDDPEYCPSFAYRAECVGALDAYVAKLVAERQGSGCSDLITILTGLMIQGEKLDLDGFAESFATFIIATNETARHTMTRAMIALEQFPAERDKMKADPALIPAAVKECVRWVSPLIHARRTATADTEIAGQPIRAGDKVVIWYKSANRDERRWPDAMQFRIDRYLDKTAPAHIAFGSGINHCLGWRYAELQIAVVFEEMYAALPDIKPSGPPNPIRSNFFAGIKSLDVEFTPVAYTA
jgi:linalool 8-monooxygenase